MDSKLPEHIVAAINALLAPYGVQFSPERGPGYLSAKDAAAYLGVSRAFFYEVVQSGRLHVIKLTPGKRNGKAVYAIAELEEYVTSCR